MKNVSLKTNTNVFNLNGINEIEKLLGMLNNAKQFELTITNLLHLVERGRKKMLS